MYVMQNHQLKRSLADRQSQLDKQRQHAASSPSTAAHFTQPLVDRWLRHKQRQRAAADAAPPVSQRQVVLRAAQARARGEQPQSAASRALAASEQQILGLLKREGRVLRTQRQAIQKVRCVLCR